jgi:hypothetical protein
MEPSQAELDGLATVTRLLRANRPVEYEATPSHLKVHLPGKPAWSVCRLVDLGGEHPSVVVPLSAEQVGNLVPLLEAVPLGPRWSRIVLMSRHDLRVIGPALCAAWDGRESASAAGGEEDEPAAG